MDQKLVQRCETKVVADACNVSYGNFYLDNLGEWGVSVIKDTLYFGFNELKVSKLYKNKGFINLHFLQKFYCQKTGWDQARFSNLVQRFVH